MTDALIIGAVVAVWLASGVLTGLLWLFFYCDEWDREAEFVWYFAGLLTVMGLLGLALVFVVTPWAFAFRRYRGNEGGSK